MEHSPYENSTASQNRWLASLHSSLFLRFGLFGVGAILLFTLAYLFFGLFPLINQIGSVT